MFATLIADAGPAPLQERQVEAGRRHSDQPEFETNPELLPLQGASRDAIHAPLCLCPS